MDEQGALVVHVYTSRTQIPIRDATVTFMIEHADDTYDIIGERTTDWSGKTEPIFIDAPAVMASMSPGIPHSHSIAKVLVDHPDYQKIEVGNIEIFPGIQSLQRVPMLPLTKSQMELLQIQIEAEVYETPNHSDLNHEPSALPNSLSE